MTALESLTDKLSPLGIYNLSGDTNIMNELKAYACALDKHRENIDTLLRECFISSAESYGITLREKLVGEIKSFYPLGKRREMLIIRNSFSENDFTIDGLKKFIKSLGVTDYTISENYAMNVISVCVGGSYSDAEAKWIKKQIEDILPAHLEAYVYYGGKTWRQFELQDKTFAQLDALDLRWQDIHMQ